jgi:6-phosphofructokinase 1
MGIGVKHLFDQGLTSCMVVSGPNGDITPLYLKDVEDENGKVKPRLVNMDGQKSKMVFEDSLQYIEPADYEAARKYVSDPENYDFRKILNW